MNDVVLDLLLCDGDVLQDHLQPHRHHAGHPVHQAGADVAGHPPLEQCNRENTTFILLVQLFLFRLLKRLVASLMRPFFSLCLK